MKLSVTSALLCILLQFIAPSLQEEVASKAVAVDIPTEFLSTQADDLIKKVNAATGEKFEFKSDTTRLLRLLAGSIYAHEEAFLRELIANSCDAIRKARQAQLKASMDGSSTSDDADYKIVIKADKEHEILTITDNGIGMTHDELRDYLGTIAMSGTSKFNLEKMNLDNPSNSDITKMIGQFGVGFYSVFLVADQVMVVSKNDADKKQWIWESTNSASGSASFSLTEDPRGNTLKRGTQIILKLKPKASRFLDDEELDKIMRKYFEYDSNPIYLMKHSEEEVPASGDDEASKAEEEKDKKEEVELDETEELKDKEEKKPKTKKITVEKPMVISQHEKPIWMRDPVELKPEDYNKLYHTLTKEKTDPLTYIHVKAEGDLDFRSILYIPKRPPFNAFAAVKGTESLIKLHVRGVFVTAKLEEFLPKYLSFVRGIIDSDDIPLNISRDILQSNESLRTVQKKVLNKILEMIGNLTDDEAKYKEFFSSYGSHLKLEVIDNERHRGKIAKLLRYESSTSEGKLVSFANYIEKAKANEKLEKKKTIYYLAGSSIAEIEKSPLLEKFKAAKVEVLYMVDTVDEHCIQSLREFDDWKFQSIAKEGVTIDDEDEATKKATEEEFKPLIDYMGKVLKADVEKIVISSRLTDSPCAVVANQFGWTGNMERVMMSQTSSKDDPMLAFFAMQKKIFEINPANPLIKGMLEKSKLVTKETPNPALRTAIKALYDSTLVWSGYSVKDSKSFAKNIDRLARKVLSIEEEPEEPEPVEEPASSKLEDLPDLDQDPLDSLDLDNDEDLKGSKGAEKKEEKAKEHDDL